MDVVLNPRPSRVLPAASQLTQHRPKKAPALAIQRFASVPAGYRPRDIYNHTLRGLDSPTMLCHTVCSLWTAKPSASIRPHHLPLNLEAEPCESPWSNQGLTYTELDSCNQSERSACMYSHTRIVRTFASLYHKEGKVMKGKWFFGLICAFGLGLGGSLSQADDPPPFPHNATFSTLITTPRAIEGLTGDHAGNLYGRGGDHQPGGYVLPCLAHQPIQSNFGVGRQAPTPCSPLGMAFNDTGDLFVADGANATVWSFTPDAGTPPTATAFATGVPGANGVAFDRDGNLWLSDGGAGQGRVWKIGASGGVCEPTFSGCEEVFRIQPMRNGTALGYKRNTLTSAEPTQGVGRQARTFPHTAAGGNPQDIVANGLAFNHRGDLFVADTARGRWKVEFDRHGNLKSQTNCDTTFTDNTLCLDNVFVAHPILEGADGIALDQRAISGSMPTRETPWLSSPKTGGSSKSSVTR